MVLDCAHQSKETKLEFQSSELEEGEIPPDVHDPHPFDLPVTFRSKKDRNHWTRIKRKAKRAACRVVANDLQKSVLEQECRIAKLKRELGDEATELAAVRASLAEERQRNSELSADLRSAEWNLISTERKLYVTTKPFPKERVLQFLKTSVLPSDGGDVPRDAPCWTRDPQCHGRGSQTKDC